MTRRQLHQEIRNDYRDGKLKDWEIEALRDDGFRLEFVNRSEEANRKKDQILEMARNGDPRPKTKLGKCLSSYILPSSDCYDEKFRKKLEKIRPDWFISRSDTAKENKEKILEMARRGEDRPNQRKHELGICLSNYISSCSWSYDKEFRNKLEKMRPDWFISSSDIAKEKKDQILEMARNGEDKPKTRKHELGRCLSNYLSPYSDCYDEKFRNQLMEIRPDWFQGSNRKKDQILEMAGRGEDRPNGKKTKLGKCLSSYLSPSSDCYDEKFRNKIMKLRPDWFRKTKTKKERV